MDITKLLKLLSIFLANGIVTVHCYKISPLSNSKDKWPGGGVLDQEDLHQTLVSIEERLKIVDSVRYGINRLEINIDRINNKLDSMESRISRLHTQMDSLESRGRLQSLMQMKLDTISQAIISAEMKYEIIPEQVVRKLDASQDRLVRRMNSIENTVESLFTKIQGSQNDLTSKIQTELGSKTIQLANTLDEIKLKTVQMENRLNNTSKEHLQHLMNIESKVAKNEQVEMLTSRLDGIHNQLNQTDVTWAQNDSPRIYEHEKDKMVNSLKSELHLEAQKFVNKFGNIYNEASKRLHAIENAVRDHIVETNGTQKEIKDRLRQVIRNYKDCDGPKRNNYDGILDVKMEDIKSYMRINFANLHDKLDGNSRKVTNLQSELLESCSTNQGIGNLEHKVTSVLDKILVTFNNKSNKIDTQTKDLMTHLKSLSSQTARTEKIVITLSHEVKQDRKNLHNALTELFGQGDSSFIAIQKIRRDIEVALKRDISPNRRTTYSNNSDAGIFQYRRLGENQTEEEVNHIKSMEVHHPDGVIKLLTDDLSDGLSGKQASPDSSNTTTILGLGESLKTTDEELESLLKWSTSNQTKYEEETYFDSKDGSIKPPNKTDDEKYFPDEFVTHILLCYIKLTRGQMSLEKFLKEANIARTYTSLPEMIKDLRGMESVPPDFIEELWQYEADKDFDFEVLKRPSAESTPEDDTNYDDDYES